MTFLIKKWTPENFKLTTKFYPNYRPRNSPLKAIFAYIGAAGTQGLKQAGCHKSFCRPLDSTVSEKLVRNVGVDARR